MRTRRLRNTVRQLSRFLARQARGSIALPVTLGWALLAFMAGAYAIGTIAALPRAPAGLLWAVGGLTLAAGFVLPVLAFFAWWRSQERLETAALAAKLVLGRCQGIHGALASQMERTLRQFDVDREAMGDLLTRVPRAGGATEGDARGALVAMERSMRARSASLGQLPEFSARINQSLQLLGSLLSSPKALPELTRAMQQAEAPAGYRTVDVTVN